MRNFRTLEVWKRAHALALAVNRTTKGFPRGERHGLTSQINRSAASVATHLAEGCGGFTDAEFAQFVRLAVRSASELDYQLLLAHDLKLMRSDSYHRLASEVFDLRRMLTALSKRLIADRSPPVAAAAVASVSSVLPAASQQRSAASADGGVTS
jgi:four helix bundle protein